MNKFIIDSGISSCPTIFSTAIFVNGNFFLFSKIRQSCNRKIVHENHMNNHQKNIIKVLVADKDIKRRLARTETSITTKRKGLFWVYFGAFLG